MSITPETDQAMHMWVQKDDHRYLLECSERLEEERDQWKERCLKLEAENAELRSLLKDSLEWLNDYGMRMSGTSSLVDRIETILAKEAQP